MPKQKTTQHNSDKWLVKTIKIGIYACLFMPLIVSASFVFPYIFPKQAFFQIVTEVLLALYFILALRQPQYRPRGCRLFTVLLMFFALMILSAIFGLNAYHSFWSDYERMAGVISLLHYLGFLFIAVNIFKTKEEWYTFFDFSIIASVTEAFYGLGQLAGVSSFLHGSVDRIDGTIGNSSFLAGYMLINALFAFWLLLEKRNWGWRIFYISAIIIDLIILYSTQTRGAILGLIAGLFILAFFFIFASKEALSQLPLRNAWRLKKYVVALALAFLLTIVLVWQFRDSAFIKSQPTLSRVAHISFQEDSTKTRLLAWRMSLNGFLERPILGWGMENYYVLFNKYYDPNLYPTESWFDRSHNAFLDVLTQMGLAGFIAYVAVFLLAFWYLLQAWRRQKINYQTAVIFAAILVSYIIQNLFVFDTQVTLLMIYSILAFVVFLGLKSPGPEQAGRPMAPNYFLFFIIGLVALASMYFFNIKPGLASAKGVDALIFLNQGRIGEANAKFKESFEVQTFGLPEVASRIQDAAIQILMSKEQLKDEDKELIALAIDGLKKSLNDFEPLNARFMLMLGNLYLVALPQEPSFLEKADAVLSEALRMSPTRQELYFAVGQIRMYQGRTEEALSLFKKAVELNPKVALSHWNYGIMAIALGQKELGEAEILKAKEFGHSYDGRDISFLINAYGKANDLPKILSLYEEWIAMEPKNASPYARAAAAYAQAGDKQKAKECALKAAELDSDFADEAEEFIKSLGP